ncbi:uncharacterized protein LOC110987368 [Acanthaster planci]|uniref:Uncharacterized protein LOC110987368 n=1 Tax=Acanthaster planci TaxID=133434 RepID=A0A8B7ZL27_ACAPL|nr:uncharacterized protein LOC110987368 [Acanthaster planci]
MACESETDRTDLTPSQLHDLLTTCVNSTNFRERDKFFEQYLNSCSFHHPKIKSSVNRAHVRRVYNICDKEHLAKELHHISTAFQRNGYKPQQIKTQRILSKYDIKVFHTAPLKIRGMLTSHKDLQDPHHRPGVYKIPCQCCKEYIGETGRDLPTRLKEHQAHCRKGEYEKSGTVEHSHSEDHRINWDQANLITSIQHWYPKRIREALEILKHDIVPQDIGISISDIWQPLLTS